ncbi:hypothetical protein CEXT_312921 [Caerostris extrusa]|uniref:Secreted protein n=1 Tax=Caerostris extrusa TaxID=172846 RepID=A0AAV4S608_CAEEX|nr:hypothetical protein CEXT_312921 [Caerostris extrusa]
MPQLIVIVFTSPALLFADKPLHPAPDRHRSEEPRITGKGVEGMIKRSSPSMPLFSARRKNDNFSVCCSEMKHRNDRFKKGEKDLRAGFANSVRICNETAVSSLHFLLNNGVSLR